MANRLSCNIDIDFIEGPIFHSLPGDSFKLYIYLWAKAVQKRKEDLGLMSSVYLGNKTGIKPNKIRHHLEIIQGSSKDKPLICFNVVTNPGATHYYPATMFDVSVFYVGSKHLRLKDIKVSQRNLEKPKRSDLDLTYLDDNDDNVHNDSKESSPPSSPPIDYQLIMDHWNDMAKENGLSLCQKLSDKRKKTIKTRMSDEYFKANWLSAIHKIPLSEFLLGSSGWKIDIDFFLKPDSVLNIMEGKYLEGSKPKESFKPREYQGID